MTRVDLDRGLVVNKGCFIVSGSLMNTSPAKVAVRVFGAKADDSVEIHKGPVQVAFVPVRNPAIVEGLGAIAVGLFAPSEYGFAASDTPIRICGHAVLRSRINCFRCCSQHGPRYECHDSKREVFHRQTLLWSSKAAPRPEESNGELVFGTLPLCAGACSRARKRHLRPAVRGT